MVARGLLQMTAAFTPRGGIEARFFIDQSEVGELPF